MTSAPAWLEDLTRTWRAREPMGGNEWAEKVRVLSTRESPQPGPWRSVPWQRELLDALADPLLEWLAILKAAQVGASEVIRCAIGRWALLDPGDTLWVMTTKNAAERCMKKLRLMFDATPALRALVSDKKTDATLLELNLTNGMRVVIGWSGSPQSMASDPFRRVVLDEVAKYRWSSQGEASPVELAKERVKIFGCRGKVVLLSSPKHDDDLICSNHRELRDRRVFAVPCPDCKLVQPIDWSSVRWPGGEPATAPTSSDERGRLADEVEQGELAWVECRGCKGKILPHRAQKEPGACWVQEEATTGATRRGYHVPEFFHLETTISRLVARFLRCTTPNAVQGFWNGSLGLAYKVAGSLIQASLFAARAIHAARVVPKWATTVLSTADTQLRGFWFMTRAWGSGGRSRLLDWGWVTSTDELLARAGQVHFDVEGRKQGTGDAYPALLAIDTGGGMAIQDGSRTRDVYEFVARTPGVFALKGEGDLESLQGKPWRESRVRLSAQKPDEIDLYLLNKNYYADHLATLIRAEEPVLWEECKGAENPTYQRQLASEQKVLVKSPQGERWLWQKRSRGAENHLWDCARYQCWAAEFARVESRTEPHWTQRKDDDDPARIELERPVRTRYD